MSAGTFNLRPGESRALGFDFAAVLATGETVSTAAFTVAVVEGTDAVAASRLVGAAAIDGSIVRQRFTAEASLAARYELRATVVTSAGNTLKECAGVNVEAC